MGEFWESEADELILMMDESGMSGQTKGEGGNGEIEKSADAHLSLLKSG